MARKKKAEEAEKRACRAAVTLFNGPLQENFATLADRTASRMARRGAAAFVSTPYVPLRVGMDKGLFSTAGYRKLTEGFWNAAIASPCNSQMQGLNMLLWEHALSGLNQRDEKAAVEAVQKAAKDIRIHKRSTTAKILANNLNFFGMIWRPYNWAEDPRTASLRFNTAAKRVQGLLQPASRETINLGLRRAEQKFFRRQLRQKAAAE